MCVSSCDHGCVSGSFTNAPANIKTHCLLSSALAATYCNHSFPLFYDALQKQQSSSPRSLPRRFFLFSRLSPEGVGDAPSQVHILAKGCVEQRARRNHRERLQMSEPHVKRSPQTCLFKMPLIQLLTSESIVKVFVVLCVVLSVLFHVVLNSQSLSWSKMLS